MVLFFLESSFLHVILNSSGEIIMDFQSKALVKNILSTNDYEYDLSSTIKNKELVKQYLYVFFPRINDGLTFLNQ